MTLAIPGPDELANARRDEEIVRQTVQQVMKDFAMFGIELHFPNHLHYAYDDLFAQVREWIKTLDANDPGKLQSILYQIDLSEKNLKLALRANTPETRDIILTELILDRELKKVLYRHFFKP